MSNLANYESPCALIVESDQTVRRVLAAMLRIEGIHPVPADSTAPRDLDFLDGAGGAPELVLVDLWEPAAACADRLRRLRRAHPRPAVVLMNGWCSPENVPAELARNVDVVLRKPFGQGDFGTAMREAVENAHFRLRGPALGA